MQVQFFRNHLLESFHQISAVVVNHHLDVQFSTGPSFEFFPRSAIKPFQSLALLQTDTFSRMNLDFSHLALASASHSGESVHTDKVKEWLFSLQLNSHHLHCGTHWPYDQQTQDQMKRLDQKPSAIHNNCSGKHCGFLSICVHKNWNLDEYELAEHPLQQLLKKILENRFSQDLSKYGIDGCSIPAFQCDFLQVGKAAATMAKNIKNDIESEDSLIFKAFQQFPVLTSGTEEYCFQKMKQNPGQLLLKEGAEGVMLAVLPGQGLGVLVKSMDGSERASVFATEALLEKFAGISPLRSKNLKNWALKDVGHIQVQF